MKNKKYRVTTDALKVFDKGETVVAVDCDGKGFPVIPTEHNGIDKKIVERNPNWFEPVGHIEAGQYWKTGECAFPFPDKEVIRIKETTDTHAYYQSITSNASGNGKKKYLVRRARKLSTDEIEEVLDEERKRRGYVVGAKIKSLKDESVCEIEANNIIYNAKENLNPADTLFLNSWIIYQQGEWAETIDQTPDIEINGHKFKGLSASGNWLEFDCGERIIKDQFDIFRAFVNIYDLKVYRQGEDITDQIKQIANYYSD